MSASFLIASAKVRFFRERAKFFLHFFFLDLLLAACEGCSWDPLVCDIFFTLNRLCLVGRLRSWVVVYGGIRFVVAVVFVFSPFPGFGDEHPSFVPLNEAAVIGEEQCGEREGDDEPDKAEQRPPHGQGQEDDGRVQPHQFAHDFGHQEGVFNALDHDEHDARSQHDEPEIF